MEAISYYAIDASSKLAKERGSYASYPGSLWSSGIMPIDSLKMLANERGAQYLDVNTDTTDGLGEAAQEGAEQRHAQFKCHGHCSHRDHRQHHRRIAVDRADLPESVRQIEPVRRIHRG